MKDFNKSIYQLFIDIGPKVFENDQLGKEYLIAQFKLLIQEAYLRGQQYQIDIKMKELEKLQCFLES